MSKYLKMKDRHGIELSGVDFPKSFKIISRQKKELEEEIQKDKTGNGFIKEMFRYEMGNTEYHVMEEQESVLDQIGLTEDYVNKHSNVKKGFELARKEYMKNYH